MDWSKYGQDKLIMSVGSINIIKPNDYSISDPIFCPNCKYAMRLTEDSQTFKEFSCCGMCATIWARKFNDKWSAGWRPTQDEVSEEMKIRRPPKPFIPMKSN